MKHIHVEQFEDDTLKVDISQLDIPSLPSGALNSYSVDELPLIKYEIWNKTASFLTVKLVSEIQNLSYPLINQESLPAYSHTIHYQLPLPIIEKVAILDSDRGLPLGIKIQYPIDHVWYTAYDATPCTILILAHNTLRLYTANPEGGYVSLLKHLVAWVTPLDDTVQQWVSKVASSGQIPGYQPTYGPSVPNPTKQVEFIYQELKAQYQGKYVDSSSAINTSEDTFDQRVRQPKKSLELGLANCLDGAVLFASLIEAINLDAVIVIGKKHAFVGWKTDRREIWEKSPKEKQYEFLETTMIRSGTFEYACETGRKKYNELKEQGLFESKNFDKNSFAFWLDVKKLRDELSRKQNRRYEYKSLPLPGRHGNEEGQEATASSQEKQNGVVQTAEPAFSSTEHSEESALPHESTDKEPARVSLCGTGQHRAIIVGVNNFEAMEEYGLQLCANDAELLYQQLLVSSFAPERLHLLTNRALEKAESNNLLNCLRLVANYSAPDDLLLFYYSGTLWAEGQNYYFGTMSGSKLPVSQVKEVLIKAPALAKVAVLDISNAALLASKEGSQKGIKSYMQGLLEHFEGISVLASYKIKMAEMNTSKFTHYLVQSIAKEASEEMQEFITIQDVSRSLADTNIILYPSHLGDTSQIILCRLSREQREYFLTAYRSIIKAQQILEYIQPKISNSMTKPDCEFAIDKLQLIPLFPSSTARSRSDAELDLADDLDRLCRLMKDLKHTLDILRHQQLEAQRYSRVILTMHNDAIWRAKEIADKLKASILPEEASIKKAKSY